MQIMTVMESVKRYAAGFTQCCDSDSSAGEGSIDRLRQCSHCKPVVVAYMA